MNLGDELVEWLQKRALGPDYRRTATAYPLSAYGGLNKADDWYGTENGPKKRVNAPTVTVRSNREWAASIMVSPTGKNLTVYVPKGTKVVEVGQ